MRGRYTIAILAIPLLAFQASEPAAPAAQFVRIESRSGHDCPGHHYSVLVSSAPSRAISATIRTWGSHYSAPYCEAAGSNATRIVQPGGEQKIGCNYVEGTPRTPCGYSLHYTLVSAAYVN
jgi:hypothetical protein